MLQRLAPASQELSELVKYRAEYESNLDDIELAVARRIGDYGRVPDFNSLEASCVENGCSAEQVMIDFRDC
ncbi:MAG: hypothetical protein AAFQ22_13655, partial [Pseudomonadota bacterium]